MMGNLDTGNSIELPNDSVRQEIDKKVATGVPETNVDAALTASWRRKPDDAFSSSSSSSSEEPISSRPRPIRKFSTDSKLPDDDMISKIISKLETSHRAIESVLEKKPTRSKLDFKSAQNPTTDSFVSNIYKEKHSPNHILNTMEAMRVSPNTIRTAVQATLHREKDVTPPVVGILPSILDSSVVSSQDLKYSDHQRELSPLINNSSLLSSSKASIPTHIDQETPIPPPAIANEFHDSTPLLVYEKNDSDDKDKEYNNVQMSVNVTSQIDLITQSFAEHLSPVALSKSSPTLTMVDDEGSAYVELPLLKEENQDVQMIDSSSVDSSVFSTQSQPLESVREMTNSSTISGSDSLSVHTEMEMTPSAKQEKPKAMVISFNDGAEEVISRPKLPPHLEARKRAAELAKAEEMKEKAASKGSNAMSHNEGKNDVIARSRKLTPIRMKENAIIPEESLIERKERINSETEKMHFDTSNMENINAVGNEETYEKIELVKSVFSFDDMPIKSSKFNIPEFSASDLLKSQTNSASRNKDTLKETNDIQDALKSMTLKEIPKEDNRSDNKLSKETEKVPLSNPKIMSSDKADSVLPTEQPNMPTRAENIFEIALIDIKKNPIVNSVATEVRNERRLMEQNTKTGERDNEKENKQIPQKQQLFEIAMEKTQEQLRDSMVTAIGNKGESENAKKVMEMSKPKPYSGSERKIEEHEKLDASAGTDTLFRQKYETEKEKNRELQLIMDEYEQAMVKMMQDTKRMKDDHSRTNHSLNQEKAKLEHDIEHMELAFKELHRRYEESKVLQDNYRKNEEQLQSHMRLLKEDLVTSELRHNAVKLHAEEKLSVAQSEIEKTREVCQKEVSSLEAKLLKAEIQIKSLEATVETKTRENKELMSICDELICKLDAAKK